VTVVGGSELGFDEGATEWGAAWAAGEGEGGPDGAVAASAAPTETNDVRTRRVASATAPTRRGGSDEKTPKGRMGATGDSRARYELGWEDKHIRLISAVYRV
jgi:hypothetical protein